MITRTSVIVLFLFALIIGCTIQTHFPPPNAQEVIKYNKVLGESAAQANDLCQRQYGVRCINSMYVAGSMLVVDYTEEALRFSLKSKEEQIDGSINEIRKDKRELNWLGIYKIRVKIDGERFKDYEI